MNQTSNHEDPTSSDVAADEAPEQVTSATPETGATLDAEMADAQAQTLPSGPDGPAAQAVVGDLGIQLEGDDSDVDSDEGADQDPDDDGDQDDESEDSDGPDSSEPEGKSGGRRARSSKTDELETEGDVAADYLEELLDIADLDGDIDTFVEGGRAHVSVVTDADTLVGPNGEVLEALQELSRLAVMTETGTRSRLMLDIAGHRERRRQELQDVARDAISEVNSTGEAARLAPMNPFERKIVHDAVAAAGLVSESEGVEPQRRVVVLPKQ